MGYGAKVLADSVSQAGKRITTVEVTMPRIVLAELNTHRMFSRNSASSRAIPVAKMLERVKKDPFIPIYWGSNKPGMQAGTELSGWKLSASRRLWLLARTLMVFIVTLLNKVGLHKQIANRLLEPWVWHTVIITATEWENAMNLRRDPNAQPEIRRAFDLIHHEMAMSLPRTLTFGEWHLPLVPDFQQLLTEGYAFHDIAKISCGRCARVSYLTHDGVRDPKADLSLADDLRKNGHMSPFEHAAYALEDADAVRGNFLGWMQYRKTIPGEAVFQPKQSA